MTDNVEELRKLVQAAIGPEGDTQRVDQLIKAVRAEAREEGREAGYRDGYSWGLSQGATYVGEPGFPLGYDPRDL
jgi:flagellar biosynthesis/type III secretory pathway protein FliH